MDNKLTPVVTSDVSLLAADVRVRAVGPHIHRHFRAKMDADIPPAPERPTKDVETKDGRIEQVEVGRDDERYAAWIEALEEWEAERLRTRTEYAMNWNDLVEDYAVVAWRWRGADEWIDQPPDGWEHSEALTRAGLPSSGNRRLDYIREEVLVGTGDIGDLWDASIVTDLEEAEVQLHLDGFPPIAIGGRGNTTESTADDGAIHEYVSHRSGDGTRCRSFIGRLVCAITGRTGSDGGTA